jgi:hypothetical protein
MGYATRGVLIAAFSVALCPTAPAAETFMTGRVGFGSFDDTGNIDDVLVWGSY